MLRNVVWITAFAVVCLVTFAATRSGYNEGQKNGVQQGYEQSIGRPMKYSDLPRGQYKVVAVVNEYSQTAVVQKQSLADGLIREDAKQYFLVTDMMPQQMQVGYMWGEIQ